MPVIASLSVLPVALFNYFRTIRLYSERRAIVQVGFKTQSVAVVIGSFVISIAILFTVTNAT